MASLNFNWEVVFKSGDQPIRLGSFQLPLTVSTLTQSHYGKISLATANTKIILNLGAAATDDLPDADFILVVSDKDLDLEIIGTNTADNSNVKLKANIPFILGYDDTRAYNAAGGFAGAAQNITKLTVNNTSGATAIISVLAVT